jgi:hypothetical protein
MKTKRRGKEKTAREVAAERLRDTAQEQRKDEIVPSDVLGLTCAEANLDAILSDGESV